MPRAGVVRRAPRAWDHAVVGVVVLGLVAWVLGPSLGRGLYLYRDFVAVPDPVIGSATWGSPGVPPRAAPLDAVTVALAPILAPGVQQQVMLVLCLVLAGAGAAALVSSFGLAAMVTAAVVAIWNPFVVERLLVGQPPTLLAYSVLPWLVVVVRSRLRPGTCLALVALAAAPAALTPWGGVSAAVAVAVAAAVTPHRRGWWLVGLGALAVLWCVPWLVPALLHAGSGADPDGATAFAVGADTPAGTLWSVLTLGGVWAPAARPASRGSLVAALASGALLALAAFGVAVLWRSGRKRAACWLTSAWLVPPVAAWALSGGAGLRAFEALQGVPGVALARDTHRWLAPSAVAVAVLAGVAVARVAHQVRSRGAAVTVAAVPALVAGSLAVMNVPDLPATVHAAYRPTSLPRDWAAMVAATDAAAGESRVLVLPWSAFRQARGGAQPHNGRRPFLDPLPRALRQEVVLSRELVVVRDGRLLRVDDDPSMLRALVSGRLDAAALRRRDIAAVVVWRDMAGLPGDLVPGPGLSLVHDGPGFTVWAVTRPVP